MPDPIFVVTIIFLALLFNFINGMNDAANAIATVVSTKVLSPKVAVLWAAFFNFLAAFVFGVGVASTIGKGIIDPAFATETVIFCALIGGIIWSWACTYLGFPISVSHALIGGFVGAAVTKAGFKVVIVSGISKVIAFIFLSPLIGFVLGVVLMNFVYAAFRHASPSRVDGLFRKFQLVSAALFSLSHGSNDAQKTMGIIAALLFSSGYLGATFYVPYWVIFTCYLTMAAGTLSGGWGVINTMGSKITKLKPVSGFCAEAAGAVTIICASFFGIPVSTTHTISGSIMGVGSAHRVSAVRWSVAKDIFWTWVLTIPASAAMSAAIYWFIQVARR